MDKVLYLVEELENRLANEAVNYQHKCNRETQSIQFDPNYFDKFISGELYIEFVQAIYDRIKPLNSHEANRFLTVSVAQFTTHTPTKREEAFILNYHNTYWFPNVVALENDDYTVTYAKHVWKHYTNHFYSFKAAAEKGLEDFKAGLIGSQSLNTKAAETDTKPIVYEWFDNFIKLLEFNYPYYKTPVSFKYELKDCLFQFKQEILINLINLNVEDRRPYLNRLNNAIQDKKQYAYYTDAEIEIWLVKYNIASEEKLFSAGLKNELYRMIARMPPSIDDEIEVNFNGDTHDVQMVFYNYYYGLYIDDALDFISVQLNEHSTAPVVPNQAIQLKQEPKTPTLKLKTNLSVPQLALLFKMLKDLKPDIFELESEAELLRFISASFETKKSNEGGISIQKLRILFNKPDAKAADFWEKHFYTFNTEIKKFK